MGILLLLVLAVALHNIPEGAIISMPLRAEGGGNGQSFLYGILFGIVELLAAVLSLPLILIYVVLRLGP